jgi:hypothetical protein
MTKRYDTHNRFAEEADTIPSRLDELTVHRRVAEREQRRAGWRRNFAIFAAVVVVALVARMMAS